jgi:hypothetical protein
MEAGNQPDKCGALSPPEVLPVHIEPVWTLLRRITNTTVLNSYVWFVTVLLSSAARGAAAGPEPSEEWRTAAVEVAGGQTSSSRPRHPPGLVTQTGQRGTHAVEEALVRSVGVLPFLLQR